MLLVPQLTRRTRRVAAAGAGFAAAVVVALPSAAQTAPATYTVTTEPVHAAAGWLATQFVDQHYLPTPAGDRFVSAKYGGTTYLNYGENADAIFGLAAAKVGGTKIAAAWNYLAANLDAYTDLSNSDGYGPYDGALGKTALAALVAGHSPTSVAGHNLLQELKNGECSAADAPSCAARGGNRNTYTSNSESFVLLAEARAGGAYAPSPNKIGYFLTLQCVDGGFTGDLTACGSGAADLDATSYAVMVLEALGGHATELAHAVTWLAGQQQPGGFWVNAGAPGVPNANSTGLAAAALHGAGADVSEARTWLRRQQVPAGQPAAGAFRFGGTVLPSTPTATSPSVLATAQALTGLVDGGGLATVSAAGAANTVPVYAPVASVSAPTVRAGRSLTATGVGFVAGERVNFALHSSPATVVTVTAGPLGTAAATFTVPSSTANGAHEVVLTGVTSGLVAGRAVTVTGSVAPSSSPASSTSPTGSPAPTSAGSTVAPAGVQSLAATGLDRQRVTGLSIAGALTVLVGIGLVTAGRGRRHAH